MLRKEFKLSLSFLGLAGFAFASSAVADSHEGTTGGNLKVGLQYNAGLTYDDKGLEDTKAADKDPGSETMLGLNTAKLTGSAEAAKDVHFSFQYNLQHGADENGVEKAYATWKHSDMLSFSIGRAKANQGGYEGKSDDYNHVSPYNPYVHNLPFAKYSDQMAVHVALAGKLTLQLLNDQVTESSMEDTDGDGVEEVVFADGRFNDKNKQPGMALEWIGDFNGWMPLVQIGRYDLNHSMYYVLGVKGSAAGVGVSVDYTTDQRKWTARAASGSIVEDADATDTLTALNLKVDYGFAGFTPWLEFHMYNAKQGDNDDIAREDIKGNDVGSTEFEDNGTSWTVGAACNAFGAGYEPYLAIVSEAGKFIGSEDATEEETLNHMMVKFGVYGTF